MKRKKKLVIVASLLVVLLAALFIKQKTDLFFRPMSNFNSGKKVALDMDMNQVVLEGIVIPSARQTPSGMFDFRFSFFKPGKKHHYYKIYYQNESYKFPDDHRLASENFYGSWENVSIGFKPLSFGFVKDSLRIVGNPRDEKLYYGANIAENEFDVKHVEALINEIKSQEAWYQSIVKKAEVNGVSVDDQLYKDAMWTISERKNHGDFNHRWKRNPRVGEYSFMLVVCDEEGLTQIPDYIQHIGQTNEEGQFVNPYSWFSQNKSSHIKVIKSSRKLKTKAVISVDKGIFVDESKLKSRDYYFDTTSCNCGEEDTLYKSALYEQFFSSISRQYTLRNIPVIQDVVGENPYTVADYEANKNRFDSSQLQMDYPVVSDRPCQTVRMSDSGNYITLINPGNDNPNELQKESTGISTRVGFTYGKFRGRIKFPVMLNEENVWNGLTYAFWLIYSDNNKWNNRRHSQVEKGYIEKNDDSENPVRLADYHYSEIDIEIVKASRHWPKGYYYNRTDTESFVEDARLNSDVMYCCTNWDLANTEPEHFSVGIDSIPFQDTKFETMRWTPTYKALTTRTPMTNEVFKEQWYYYEIEWKPTEIIWRLGSSPEKMEVVGYMSDSYTNIPNNQMKCIVTQEYHYSEWWPPIVWEQGLIPYNKTDIEGRVYEIVVE